MGLLLLVEPIWVEDAEGAADEYPPLLPPVSGGEGAGGGIFALVGDGEDMTTISPGWMVRLSALAIGASWVG